jgi:hypothetical protein
MVGVMSAATVRQSHASARWWRTDIIAAAFLAAAIQHYVDHPEHRAAIGTPAEYRRLFAELPGPHRQLQATEM